MDNLSAFDSSSWDPKLLPQHPAYISGNALAWLYRGNKQASVSYPLSGRLYLTKANWLMLSVPNALVRGVFDAISAPGAELPTQSATGASETTSGLGDVLNANIAVMTADEVAKIGADSINERGHSFGYALSGMTELAVSHLPGVSKAWALQISAPSLSALRKSYGLSPTPRDQGKFHILVAVRRKGVLSDNGQAKGYETPVEAAEGESFSNPISRGELKAAADITKLSPKWSDREHLLAALPKHLTDTQAAMSTPGGNVDKEMTDLALIARAWLKSQQQKELLAARLKKFQETAAYPSLALQPPAAAILPSSKVLPQALSKGLTDEQGHASNDQVAKAAATDHLQKDARDYEEEKLTDKLARTQILKELLAAKEHSDNKRYAAKHDILARLMAKAPQDWEIDDPKPKYKGITHKPTQFRFHTPPSAIPSSLKFAGSVYAAQARDYLNLRQPIVYDSAQPFSANIANQLRTIKRRGDFALQRQRHLQASRAAADPRYRQQLALQAFQGTLPQPSAVDRAIESIDVEALMPNVNSWAGK